MYFVLSLCHFAFCLLSYIAFSTETLFLKFQLNHLKLVFITRMQHWTSICPTIACTRRFFVKLPEMHLDMHCLCRSAPGRVLLLFRRAIALQKDSGSGVPIVSVTESQLRCWNIPLLAGKKTWGSRNKFGFFLKQA